MRPGRSSARRVWWSCAAVVLVLGACGGDDPETAGSVTDTNSTTTTSTAPTTTVPTSTTTTTPPTTVVPAEVPAFVVATPESVDLVAGGRVEPYGTVDGAELVFAFGGDDAETAVVQTRLDGGTTRGLPPREIRFVDGSEERVLDLGTSPELHDVAVIDGARMALATRDEGGVEREARLVLVDLDTGEQTELANARAPAYGVSWASVGGDLIVTSASADLTERVEFIDLTGAKVDLASPTDDLAYAAPPLVVGADLTADDSRLAWAEGPELGDASQPEDAPWELLLSEPGGAATSRLTVPEAGVGDQVTRIDLRGRWALVSVSSVDLTDFSTSPSGTWLFDLSVAGGAPVSVPVVGEATFVG